MSDKNSMMIELGPRTVGRCQIQLPGCGAHDYAIVKKYMIGTGDIHWVCEKCIATMAAKERESGKKIAKSNLL